jgi:hypothetical protein
LSLPIEPSQTTLDAASGTGLGFLRMGKGKAQSDRSQYYEKGAPGHCGTERTIAKLNKSKRLDPGVRE